MFYNANDIMWVEYWCATLDPTKKIAAIQYEKDKSGLWTCEIDMPILGVIRKQSFDLIDIVLKAAKEAADKIDGYMSEHPELIIGDTIREETWILEPDDDWQDYTIMSLDSYEKINSNRKIVSNNKKGHQVSDQLHLFK